MATFFQTVTAAVADLAEHGFDSEERIDHWVGLLQEAAKADLVPEYVLDMHLRHVLRAAYDRLVERGGLLKRHSGVSRFTLEFVKPKLRAELDRRIMASANLIRLNREATIADTLRRFQGWATSIPAGGQTVERKPVKNDIRKELASLPFRERRVLIDQGHKLNAAISDILAADAGAIAARWRSNWRQANYDYREEHKERDRVVYATRDSWAIRQGLMKADPVAGYYEDHERPGEFVYCRCFVVWIYNLRDLPPEMLTERGRTKLAEVRRVA
jgi:hypothetical protein